jgi:SAM-dependent methyltransferase
MELNPLAQYADDRNLSARQRLWRCQVPSFDIAGWAVELAGLAPGQRVLDAGCGNGIYLRALRERRVSSVGCDLSLGMLRGAVHPAALINADVTALPVRDGVFDVVLAAHLLDLVPDRSTAVRELRRALAPGGTCVAVTTGAQHLRSLRDLIERAARAGTPGWTMSAPTGSAFTAENAAAQLGVAFSEVACLRPRPGQVIITDASVAADYVTSLADHYQPQVARPWPDIAEDVREQVQAFIDTTGEFRTAGDLAAFACR